MPSDPYHAFDESWGPTQSARKEPLQEWYVRPLPSEPAKWSVLGIAVWTTTILAITVVLLYVGGALVHLFARY
jgi:hypothetical protein